MTILNPLEFQVDALDERAAQLEDPYGSQDVYNPATDQWITSYGGGTGLIVYAIAAAQRRVLILSSPRRSAPGVLRCWSVHRTGGPTT